MLLNCGAGEVSWESLGQQGDKPVNPKGNQPWYSLEGLMLKLKCQYFGHLMWRADSLEKTLMLGKTESGRRRGQQTMRCWMASPTWWTWVWGNSGDSEGQGSVACCSSWGCKESDVTERLNNNKEYLIYCETVQFCWIWFLCKHEKGKLCIKYHIFLLFLVRGSI